MGEERSDVEFSSWESVCAYLLETYGCEPTESDEFFRFPYERGDQTFSVAAFAVQRDWVAFAVRICDAQRVRLIAAMVENRTLPAGSLCAIVAPRSRREVLCVRQTLPIMSMTRLNLSQTVDCLTDIASGIKHALGQPDDEGACFASLMPV